MRLAALALLLACALGCGRAHSDSAPSAGAVATAGATPAPSAELFPLRVSGTAIVDASGKPFEWRGITAFRLAEMIAGGRETEAAAYLDWARSEQLTVVRVLLMAQHLFKLPPDAGRGALPRLLDLAKARGIAVEAVPLADTKDVRFDMDAHVREVGRIALEKGNAFVEIANEPGHPTQDARLHDAGFVKRLADLVPEPVIVALGSLEFGEGYAAGDYATTHVRRGEKPWDHVYAVAEAVRHVIALKKPVISDEPIGAGPRLEPGRRDNEPARFAAAAALTRLAGMGATFHYEGGLHARIPSGREAACLAGWQSGLALLSGVSLEGEFVQDERAARIARPSVATRLFARVGATDAVVLLIDPAPGVTLTWAEGWKQLRQTGVPGASVALAVKDGQ